MRIGLLAMQAANPQLPELRDVHLPDPVSLWPPAIGWWVLLGLIVIGGLAGAWLTAYRRRTKGRRQALAELHAVKQQYGLHRDDRWMVQRLSELVRRYALAVFPRSEVAGLAGPAWLRFLDKTGKTNQFTEGNGQLLDSGPYRPTIPDHAASLLPVVEQWIRHVSPPARSRRS